MNATEYMEFESRNIAVVNINFILCLIHFINMCLFVINLYLFHNQKLFLKIIIRERERESTVGGKGRRTEVENPSRLQALCGPQLGAQFHDPGIMT